MARPVTMSSESGARRRVVRGLDRLERAFGRPRPERRIPPLDELILTVLSQHTNDTNRDRAYESLRRRFPSWREVLRARRTDVESAIRVGGLAGTKSRVIQDVLRRILQDHGRLDLSVLGQLSVDDAKAYLRSLRGVGEKTACCVLLFALDLPAFPVDTHIHRVSRRLGWVSPRATPAATHARLGVLIPERRYYSAHINLIRLGRRLCRARAPECPSCPLRADCRHASAMGAPALRLGSGKRRSLY